MSYPSTYLKTQLVDLFTPETTIGELVLIYDGGFTLTEASTRAAWLALEVNTGGRVNVTMPADTSYTVSSSGVSAFVNFTFNIVNQSASTSLDWNYLAIIDSTKVIAYLQESGTLAASGSVSKDMSLALRFVPSGGGGSSS